MVKIVHFILIATLAVFVPVSLQGQSVSGYALTSSHVAFVPLGSDATSVALNDWHVSLTLPFDFQLGSSHFSQGQSLSFTDGSGIYFVSWPGLNHSLWANAITTTNLPVIAACAFGNGSTFSSIKYMVDGSVPGDSTLIVEMNQTRVDGGSGYAIAQIVLHQSGIIDFCYDTVYVTGGSHSTVYLVGLLNDGPHFDRAFVNSFPNPTSLATTDPVITSASFGDLKITLTPQGVTPPPPPECLAPQNLSAVAGVTSVDLDWTPRGNESSWNVKVSLGTLVPEDYWDTIFVVTTHPVTVQNLMTESLYVAEVEAICSDTQSSGYSEHVMFQTDYDCNRVKNLQVSTSENSAYIYWTPGDNNTGVWELKYQNMSVMGSSETTVSTTSQNYSLNELDNGSYQVGVRALCSEDDPSGWEYVNFTVDVDVAIAAVQNIPVTIFPNPVTNGTATIRLSGMQDDVSIEVVSLDGRTVSLCDLAADDNDIIIPLKGLAPGAYLVRVKGSDTDVVRKLVVR